MPRAIDVQSAVKKMLRGVGYLPDEIEETAEKGELLNLLGLQIYSERIDAISDPECQLIARVFFEDFLEQLDRNEGVARNRATKPE